MIPPASRILRPGAMIAVACAFAASGLPREAAAETRVYTTQRAERPPRIDGRLDDSVWNQVDWAGDFLTREPAEGELPTGETQFKILYDDANLYVAYRAHDPEPERMASILGRRDTFPGDWAEINIDSYDDDRTAFSFTISSSGTQGDEFISEDGDNWDGNWDPIWESEARQDAQGWTAEVRIPFSQLRYAQKEEHVWGIQVQRRIYREEERSAWQTIPKDENGWVSQFGELRGIRGIEAQRQVEILPYTVAQGERFRKVDGDPFADGSTGKVSLGVDGKVGVTSDLTLDFTINPDFGQVEADPSEVNLTAFESFFQEKRPFFIEGANIFDYRIAPSVAFGTHTRDRMFYSRRIGRAPAYRADFNEEGFVDQPDNTSILGAVKLTGKTAGGLSIGVLESVTAREQAEVSLDGVSRDVTVEPASNFFVGRAQKDYREGQTR
ncbi:MAG: carbohydrate binding family 9 domain-containing protein, partial [Gemmatimonadetes bacterium]|nr:carbohydrate binding family 9 domain-containing protein [Gemmatimonadota bacterium]